MAPALTQAAEHPSLVEASRQSPPPPSSRSASASPGHAPYEGIKLKGLFDHSRRLDSFIKKLIPNGDRFPSGLAPPASGRAEGCPVPPILPRSCTMEEPPPLQLDESHNLHENTPAALVEASEQSSKLDSNMGFQNSLSPVVGSPAPDLKKDKEIRPTQNVVPIDANTTMNNQQNELLALMGRDFNNDLKGLNDIIDTLQRIASNPELLNEASSELATIPAMQNESAQTSQEALNSYISRLTQRQIDIESKRVFLLRRLQRVTARGLGCSVSVQISHLISHGKAILENEKMKLPKLEEKVKEEDIGIGALHTESMKNMSTSDLVTLVRRMEASQNLQRMNAISKQSSSKLSPPLPTELADQIEAVTSEMNAAAMDHVHHDSDATESSSGGESCDEQEEYLPPQDYKPVRQRAFYKYCRRRSYIASKWAWLQSEIAILDEKIQEQERQIMELRSDKTSLTEDIGTKLKVSVRSPAHFDAQDPALTCLATSSSLRTTINGYHPATKVEDPSSLPGVPFETSPGCARVAGVKRLKRRRYIRPNVSLKRRKLSSSTSSSCSVTNDSLCDSVNGRNMCSCVPPVTCILCVKLQSAKMCKAYGDFSLNFSKIGTLIPFHKSLTHRLAKLDPAFHPALSQPSEVLQGEFFSGMMHSPEWFQRAFSTTKPCVKDDSSPCITPEDCEPYRRTRRDRESKRNSSRRWREDGKERIMLINKRSSFGDNDEEYGVWQVSSGGSNQCSPCPSPALASDRDKLDYRSSLSSGGNGVVGNSSNNNINSTSVETRSSHRKMPPYHKNKNASVNSSSFDINNIVIPQSMAAASRVEPLQYKEITTPKWRIEEIYPLRRPTYNEDDEEEEDISDEAITIRHNRSEELERKKFLQYLQYHNSVRSRPRRTDSSGTNTPDNPLSPRTLEPSENSPIGSPPLTPQMVVGPSEDSNQSTSAASAAGPSTASSSQATVLTLSLSSLQSSMLKSNNQGDTIGGDEEQLEILNSSSPSAKPTSAAIEVLSGTQPVSRLKRLLHRGKGFRPINAANHTSSMEEEMEEERISPFPCRTFPLKENDYADLVQQTSSRTSKSRFFLRGEAPTSPVIVSKDLAEEQDKTTTAKEPTSPYVIPINVTDVLEENESGRDSPLSELTDSAPDEDAGWDSASATPPDWTISAIQDDSGSYVLQIQRN